MEKKKLMPTSHKKVSGKEVVVALLAIHGLFLIIIGLIGSSTPVVATLATSYVFVVATVGPVLARFTGGPAPVAAGTPG